METTLDRPMALSVPPATAKRAVKRHWLLQVSGCRGFGLSLRRVRYSKAVNYIGVVGNIEVRAILFT